MATTIDALLAQASELTGGLTDFGDGFLVEGVEFFRTVYGNGANGTLNRIEQIAEVHG